MLKFGNIHYNSRNALFKDLAERYHISTTTARKWYTDKQLDNPRAFDQHAVSQGKTSQLALFISNQHEPEPILLDLGDMFNEPHHIEESRQMLYPMVRSDIRVAKVSVPVIHAETLYPAVRSDVNLRDYPRHQLPTQSMFTQIAPVNLTPRRAVKFPLRVGNQFVTNYDELVQAIWENTPYLTIDVIRFALNYIALTPFIDKGWGIGWLRVYDRLHVDDLAYAMTRIANSLQYDTHHLYLTAFGNDYRLTHHGQLLVRDEHGSFKHADIVYSGKAFGYNVNQQFIDAHVLRELSRYKDANFVAFRDMDKDKLSDYTAVKIYTPQGKLVTRYTLTKPEK